MGTVSQVSESQRGRQRDHFSRPEPFKHPHASSFFHPDKRIYGCVFSRSTLIRLFLRILPDLNHLGEAVAQHDRSLIPNNRPPVKP